MKRSLSLILLSFVCIAIHAQTMNVATYNLRNDNKGDSIAGNENTRDGR